MTKIDDKIECAIVSSLEEEQDYIKKFWKRKKKIFLAKDNFWTERFPTTSSSNFLKNFYSGLNSTVVDILEKQGFFLIGKTILDEFACGGTGLNSGKKIVFNPHNREFVSGGSSSGSSWAVAKEIVPFALGHDTGDSIRRPASYCGVIGFKPSYGIISRYGVMPMASSFDTVGIIAKKVDVVGLIFSKISKKDARDLLTENKRRLIRKHQKKGKIAIISKLENFLSKEIREIYVKKIDLLKNLGYSVEEIEIPSEISDYLQISYLILCSSELVSHLNCLQGVTFGNNNRNANIKEEKNRLLGDVVKQRLIMGAYFLKNNYLIEKAQRHRQLIDDWNKKIFQEFDLLIFPSTKDIAPKAKDLENSFSGLISSHWSDNLLLLANFSGLPSITLPIGFVNGLPIGISINATWGNDKFLLIFSKEFENSQ